MTIDTIMELFTQWLFFKAIIDLIKVIEQDRTHLKVVYVTCTSIKVKKILIPRQIPSSGIKVMRLRGRIVGVRLYFSVSAKHLIRLGKA